MSRREFLAAGAAVAAVGGRAARARAMAAEPALPGPARQDHRPELRQVPPGPRQGRADRHRHALGRRAGVVRRRPLPAVERHPEQPHHAVGRGDRRGQRVPQAGRTTPTATRATGRGGCSPASTTRGASRAPSTTARSRSSPTGSTASRSTRRTTSCASPTARSGSPTRRSASSATTRATSPSPSCRRTCTAWIRRRGKLAVVAGDVNRPNGLAFSPDESKLYVVEAGVDPAGDPRLRRHRRRHASSANKRRLIDAGTGTPDGLRVDVDGNLWVGWGMGAGGARRRRGVQPGREADRPHRPAGALREPVLRRPAPQPAVHVRQHVGVLAVREHAGRGRRLSRPGARPGARGHSSGRHSGPAASGSIEPRARSVPQSRPGTLTVGEASTRALWRAGKPPDACADASSSNVRGAPQEGLSASRLGRL